MPFGEMLLELLSGLLVSAEIFVFTLALALPLGLVVAGGRMAKNPFVSQLFRLYISVVRGTPLMLQILFVYFAPYIFFKMPLSHYPRLFATVLAFGFNYAAYFAEIYRGGIESIPVGQYEAAEVLGYTKTQTFMRIILPQVIKIIMPSVTNEVITLVKDTSLAFTLAYQEVFSLAKHIAASQTSFMPFVIAGVFYFVANYIVEIVMNRIEKSMDYYK